MIKLLLIIGLPIAAVLFIGIPLLEDIWVSARTDVQEFAAENLVNDVNVIFHDIRTELHKCKKAAAKVEEQHSLLLAEIENTNSSKEKEIFRDQLAKIEELAITVETRRIMLQDFGKRLDQARDKIARNELVAKIIEVTTPDLYSLPSDDNDIESRVLRAEAKANLALSRLETRMRLRKVVENQEK